MAKYTYLLFVKNPMMSPDIISSTNPLSTRPRFTSTPRPSRNVPTTLKLEALVLVPHDLLVVLVAIYWVGYDPVLGLVELFVLPLAVELHEELGLSGLDRCSGGEYVIYYSDEYTCRCNYYSNGLNINHTSSGRNQVEVR